MFENFANLILSFFELIEAEGRTLREKTVILAEALFIMFFGVSMIIYGAFAAGAAAYLSLSPYIGRPLSALLVSVMFIGMGVWILHKGRGLMYGRSERNGSGVTDDEKKTDS